MSTLSDGLSGLTVDTALRRSRDRSGTPNTASRLLTARRSTTPSRIAGAGSPAPWPRSIQADGSSPSTRRCKIFLQRRGNPHDIVFFSGAGPRLHHVAFFAQEGQHLLKACDVAGSLGFGRGVERGPGRHGPGHAMFVYFRDPDGHRIELFNTHYQIMDIKDEPVRWDPADPAVSYPWGLPAQSRWFNEATPFLNTAVVEPPVPASPMTLERFLAAP